MPDDDLDDEGLLDALGDLANETIEVETLMGWDGEPCACTVCACERFADGGDDGRCAECRAGHHGRRKQR